MFGVGELKQAWNFPLGRGEFPGLYHLSPVELKVRLESKQVEGPPKVTGTVLLEFKLSDPHCRDCRLGYPRRLQKCELPGEAQKMHSRRVWKRETANLKF